MCGIIGIIGRDLTQAHYDAFIEAWQRAQSRGTDACGWIAATDSDLYFWKNAVDSGDGAEVFQDQFPYRKGIRFILAHTRFATSGSPLDNKNNHPLIIGPDKDLLGIHNGVIWNKRDLLQTESLESDRDVDTEIAFRLIHKYGVKSLKPFEMLRGSFNLAYCTRKQTDRFWLVRHDNPLTIRRGKDYIAFGSMPHYWNTLDGVDSEPANDTRMMFTARGYTVERFKNGPQYTFSKPETRAGYCATRMGWNGPQRTLYYDSDTGTYETRRKIWPGGRDAE